MTTIDYKIISSFREFIQQTNSLADGQRYLKNVRNTHISNYSLKDSRCIWMSLLIYKFKKEMDANDIIWGKSRNLILSVLKRDEHIISIISDFLQYFNEWKANDYQQFVADIASCYYNILQIKKSIEITNNQVTADEWEPHYNELINKIRLSCAQIGCLNALDQIIITMEEHKYNAVAEILSLAYWDKIEEDIQAGNLDVVFLNMSELKTFLDEILPNSINRQKLNDFIDIDYMKLRVKNGVFDRDFLINIFSFIMDLLTEWDALHFRERYIKEKTIIINMEDVSFSKLIRLVLEKSFYYTIDLKNRKAIWNKILETPGQT
jgi:hypothetical protein